MSPCACTLSASDQAVRAAEVRGLVGDGMLSWAGVTGGVAIRFRHDAEPALRELIAAESECCDFLDFDLRREEDGLRLTVKGPDQARSVIFGLFGLST